MRYESPIELIVNRMRIESETHLGNEIVKAVQNVGVNVDKAELLKALAYDREQYQKGYKDRENDIIRCMDCGNRFTQGCKFYMMMCETKPEFFCADAIPREGDSE